MPKTTCNFFTMYRNIDFVSDSSDMLTQDILKGKFKKKMILIITLHFQGLDERLLTIPLQECNRMYMYKMSKIK